MLVVCCFYGGDTESAYSLCDIVNDDSAVCVSVVHRCERFVALLPRSIPYFELHCSGLVECDSLCEECSADGRLSIVVELILSLGVSLITKTSSASHSCKTYLDESED